jgi:SET domain-containing protein
MSIEGFDGRKEILPSSWVDSRIEVRLSPIHGRGIFATAPIQEGEVVIIWGGVYFTLEDIQTGKASEHSFAAVRKGLFLGHSLRQGNSPDDFMNHSCDPNIWMIDEVTWVARRDIGIDEELTCDCAMYWGDDGDEPAEWDCRCGSDLCRKRFTTDDWRLTDLHERYGHHFAPYINDQIRQILEVKHL